MIPQFCFLQFVAVATSSNQQPSSFSRLRSSSQFKKPLNWLGLIIAATLHLGWLAMNNESESKQEITPPQTIMVNWIGVPEAKAPLPVVQPQRKPVKPLPEPVKTKSHLPISKTKLVVATKAESASPMTVATTEPVATPTPTASAPESAPAATSLADKSSVDANQAPMTLPNLNADYLNNPAPTYPALSRQLGEQGKVLLRALVNADGSVAQVTLRKTSGYDRLDSAALETVKQWRFVPAKRAAQPVAAWVVVPISFSLEG